MEESLHDQLARDVLDHLLEGCQVVGFDGTYLYVNEAAATQGRTTVAGLMGRTMMACYPGIDETPMFSVLQRCMNERTPQRMENEFVYPDGSRGFFELRFEPVPLGVCILSLDVTEAKKSRTALARTEEQLRQAQKMEAVGRLAGGVAHDFNNVLSVILSYSEMLLGETLHDARMREDLQEIRDAGVRAAEITRQLLTFSRQQIVDAKPLNLNDVLSGMTKMVKRLLGAEIELTLLPGNGLWNIKSDVGQLEQVVMNLAVNARDAMPSGGKLTIETANVELDSEYADAHFGVIPGEYVLVAVSDNGIGMDRETKSRMFEPFFTTKPKGKGTGLGLATVFGIVKQNGGHIWVYSEPSNGTTFKVYFPRVSGAAEVREVEKPEPDSSRGTETILLVEDDAQVRSLAAGILRRSGYVVLDAPSAGDALLVAEKHRAKIDLLLTDVVLPHMSGKQLAERLVAERPDLKVLFMSGYTDDAIMHHGILDAGVEYLEKPLTPRAVNRRVREVLRRT